MSPARSGFPTSSEGGAPAVVRAVAVLDALAASPDGALTLSEVARSLGIAKSSASAVCHALEQGGLVRRDDLGYTLGRKLVELGGAYLARLDHVAEFHDLCARSSVFRHETLRLSVLAGVDTLCLARYEGHPAVRLTSSIGDRTPASASAQGKALLAQFDDAEVERLYCGVERLPQLTRASRRSVSRLLRDLADARGAGYAVDEGESVEHVVGMAVAVPTRGVRSPLLAVSVTTLDTRATPERRAVWAAELQRFAHALGNPLEPAQATARSSPAGRRRPISPS